MDKNTISYQIISDLNELLGVHHNLYNHSQSIEISEDNIFKDQVLSNFLPSFLSLNDKIGQHYLTLKDEEKSNLENIIRQDSIFPKLLEASNIRQTIEKPYGYAGDFQLMEIIYNNGFDGSSKFGKIYNKLTTSVSSCEGVRHRRSILKKFIMDTSNGTCLSVAAGPGREISDAFSEGFQGSITAIDADMDALRYFKKKNKHLKNVSYEIVNVFGLIKKNFKTLKPKQFYFDKANPKTDTKGFKKFLLPIFYKIGNLKNKRFDLIYSAGLFDYIKTFPANKTKGTIGLTRILFDLLKPGGKLVIGIMSTQMPKGELFYMEVFCDWKIIFRSKDELMEFSKAISLNEIESIEIQEGYEGIQAYLVIQKKI